MADIQVTKPTGEQVEQMSGWPIWTCEPSKFDWHYDQAETCYILAGKVTVTAAGQSVSFAPGDMVVFPQGMDCVWDVAEPVRKHYQFG